MSLKEQNYKKHIQGMGQHLDKLQQGDFDYSDRAPHHTTLSAYAAKVRKDVQACIKASKA